MKWDVFCSKYLNILLKAGFSNLQSGRKSGVLELRTTGIRIVPVAWYCSSSARTECLLGIGVPASRVTRLRENTKEFARCKSSASHFEIPYLGSCRKVKQINKKKVFAYKILHNSRGTSVFDVFDKSVKEKIGIGSPHQSLNKYKIYDVYCEL